MADPKNQPDDEEHDGDADAEAEENGEELEVPFTLGDSSALGNQWMMVGNDEVAEKFGGSTLSAIKDGATMWAARFSGEGLDGPSADPLKTALLLRRVALAARWMTNGLFPGNKTLAGFRFGEAAHSIVLQFALAQDEEPQRIRVRPEEVDGEASDVDESEQDERRTVYPTVEGGKYLAKVLASNDSSEELVKRLRLVGRQAVRVYQGALEEFVEAEAEVNLLVPDVQPSGKSELRQVVTTPDTSEQGLKVLKRIPDVVSDVIAIEGLLYQQNSLSNAFGIQRDNEEHVTGEYDLRVADKLGPAWNKRVWAQIEVIGPRDEWMPRAGRVQRILKDVAVLKKGETRLTGAKGQLHTLQP